MKNSTNMSAILAGNQRSNRFRFRHSVAGAATKLGVPASWIWAWLLATRLKYQLWLRKVWVRLEDAQALFADSEALRNAFYATGEFLTSPEAIRRVADQWPNEYHPYIRFQAPAKQSPSTEEAVTESVLDDEEAA